MSAAVAKLKAAGSTFEGAVENALRLLKARERPKFHDARDEKLSAKAYLAQALENARTTAEAVRELRAKVDRTPEAWPYLGALRGEACRRSAELRADHGCDLDPSTNALALLGGNIERLTLCHVDCIQLGTNVLQVLALGVLDAVERHPDNFGLIESREEEKRKDAEVEAALAAIDTAWTLDDCRWSLIDEARGIGQLKLAWRGESADVNAFPREGSGGRLVAWIKARSE